MAGVADGKIPAVVIRTGEWHVIAIDEYACEYFIYAQAIEVMGRWSFQDLRIGSRVRLTAIEDGKRPPGWRGIEVEIVEL